MNNKYFEVANRLLQLDKNLNDVELNEFNSVISNYITNRISGEAFANNINELNEFFRKLNYDYLAEIMVIKNWPAIIHTDKNKLFYKYLVMAKVMDSNNLTTVRDDILLHHGKDFMTGIDLLYARIMYLENNRDLMRNGIITRRNVIKVTNSEFLSSYGISKEALINTYPFTRESLEEVLLWPENNDILLNLREVGVARRG